MMSWEICSASHIGGRKEQQDRLLTLHSDTGNEHLLVVADGAGGHANGALAAQKVIDFALEQAQALWLDEDPEAALETFCHQAHVHVLSLAKDDEMACTTLVILLLKGSEAYWAHVGDSRLYLIRHGEILLSTRDHSLLQLAQARQQEVRGGENALTISANQLYMCLGVPGDIDPEINACMTKPGDCFVLCSDGWWGAVDMPAFIANLGQSSDQDLASLWVDNAFKAQKVNGDNISLIVAKSEIHKASKKSWLAGILRFFKIHH